MAAGSTYTPIATTTLGSNAASYTFSSIPSTYTDLVLVMVTGDSTNDERDMYVRVGDGSVDTGSNYSRTLLYGNGSTASSARTSNNTELRIFPSVFNNSPNQPITINFMNYSNTTTNKTMLVRSGFGGTYTGATVGLWRSAAPINTIQIYLQPTSNLIAGSTFTLYGLAAA